jgi:hypothetical protein
MFADPSRDRAKISSARRTLPAQSSISAMGRNPRAVGIDAGCDVGAGSLPLDRTSDGFLPSKERVLLVLMQVLFFDQQDYRDRVAKAFRDAVLRPPPPPIIGGVNDDICGTPVSFFRAAMDSVGYRVSDFYRIDKLSDMFHESHVKQRLGESVCEVFFMDVVLNRAIIPGTTSGSDNGDVRVMRCFSPDDLDDSVDYKFRSLIGFVPNAGVFYCSSERRRADTGVEKTLIPHDMSWLRLHRSEVVGSAQRSGVPVYTIGDGGYIKRLHCGGSDGLPVSVWRMTYNILRDKRVIIRANQCADHDGPMLPPDVISGQCFSSGWPREVLALEFNSILAGSNSARLGGRHYATGTRYFELPSSCLVVDPVVDPMVDVVVDIAPFGTSVDRQTVVRVRHALMLKTDPLPPEQDVELRLARRTSWLMRITECNAAIRRGMRTSSGVRSAGGDVGCMYALGMRVEGDGVSVNPYAANGKVPEHVLRGMVAALCRVGRLCFPDLMHLIKTLESNSGVPIMSPMDGEDGDWVGRTVDMSVNLGNSSHFDVNDCSQGFAVWTEEIPGSASNWYFVMPNVHGTRADGEPFSGLVVRLYHGVAISWDGRVIRHCTSVSKPDGEDSAGVSSGGGQRFRNHLYGTFTACKEKVVRAGRAKACAALSSTCKDETNRGVTTSSPNDEVTLVKGLVGICDQQRLLSTKARPSQRRKKKRRRKEY